MYRTLTQKYEKQKCYGFIASLLEQLPPSSKFLREEAVTEWRHWHQLPLSSPAAAPWVAANKHSNKSQAASAGVKVFVMLTVPQKAHPREEHTANRGDTATRVIY